MPAIVHQRRRQRGRVPKTGPDKAENAVMQSNRRIYDPRRWQKRSNQNRRNNSSGGQPPAGWLFVWAGRFKRWRRRWFVAHPAGLLLHYKNSDQIGRSGCINLLGANVTPDSGKDRQFKIAKGSSVYYLRTINKEYRQAWLDAISESISTYKQSLERAAIGAPPGHSFPPQQSIPKHLRDEWEQQERESKRRLAERLQEIESDRLVFLQQLHELQESLSLISEALGFANQKKAKTQDNVSVISGTLDRSLNPQFRTARSSKPSSPLTFVDPYQSSLSTTALPQPSTSSFVQEQASQGFLPTPKMLIAENSYNSGPIWGTLTESTTIGSARRSFSFPLDGVASNSEISSPLDQGKYTEQSKFTDVNILQRRDRLSSATETDHSICGDFLTLQERNSCKDSNLVFKNRAVKPMDIELSSQGVEGPLAHNIASRHSIKVEPASSKSNSRTARSPTHSSLHAAWNNLQDAYAEVLREEICRVIELEAENLVLQDSLLMLPQLQKDRAALLELRARLKRDGIYEDADCIGREMDDEDGDEDSDDVVSIVATEMTSEEYFEALEVLNQHEFIARATSPEEQDLAERMDGAQGPPEEGDFLVDVDTQSEVEGEELDQPRIRLPAPRPLSMGFSLWTVLKNAIGKDLNHITLPATINEPLSALQRCAEPMQYRYLLETGSHQKDSLERLLLVSAFACATYCGSIHRDAKPFNPLLGETYEWQAPDGKAWFLAEQVSHHPPVMAFQGESSCHDYTFYGEIEIKNKFWGKSVEVIPAGLCHLRFPKFGEHYTWNQVTSCVHNIVMGKLWMDNYGEMVVRNHKTGEMSRIRLHKASSRDRCRVTGKVFDSQGVAQFAIHGNYMDKIFVSPEACSNVAEMEGNARCLWESPVPPNDYHQQYCFSQFAIGLNELVPRLAHAIAPTDSRFRPDQRALEDGELEKATPEKFRLEEKQRDAQKYRKANGLEWNTMWFQQSVPGGAHVQTNGTSDVEPMWIYQGKYWKARERQAWQQCPDIM
ncbi:hypothetical protein O6H91_08G089100 [Diphasiastrum complanatum]|uniref:Uncharacterized protein n=5 Tax=Diphasiastrum complanatum TaxID=34168 RepID=A0ACC2CZM7_DIPCM|nr:hypothetical protein O6H91_08G089100 [Diphasiastrum complanatum]KAJ7547514.1 hypothetical protein O6H91_08G089100 [Diphasiastrum complanatum]KAJ7547515.1 hypothetical protein O6H91_08G089100 [Diphasiastrum complanatum]KAJ7547517.1 hypothetical protein O6H91_08G089100 [Diphasiastrum complanatum]KAJ7547518.1 hypothetical protein O6H91_08G089100 [Diphasiastrum complanatum]